MKTMNGFFRGNCTGITAAALFLYALLSVGAGSAGMPPAALGEPGSQTPAYSCSIKVPEPEPVDLTSLAQIAADQAMAAALAAYPGSRVREVTLENENGCLVYRVLLSNGLEVKVDAGNGLRLRAAPEDDDDNLETEVQSKKPKAR
uniref:PepSY domain-containing protein n=1 Tax=Desulfobacca acetoxidans TaxID=60893 RepID=A0A7C5AK43_9BACT